MLPDRLAHYAGGADGRLSVATQAASAVALRIFDRPRNQSRGPGVVRAGTLCGSSKGGTAVGNKFAGAAVAGSLLLLTGCASTAVNHSAGPGPSSSAPETSTAASSATTTTSSAAPTPVSATTGGPSTAASKPSTSGGPTTTPNQSTGTVALPSISSVTPSNGSKVGVAMPIRVNFASTVSSTNRAAIEKTMKVTTTPHVDGAWSWLDSNTVDFRPQGFWPAGTKVTVQFGSTDRKLAFSIGDDHEIVVDAATHMLNVYENGALVKALPSGTGKPGWETYSGTMAVEDMVPHIEMTSCSIGIQCTKGGPGWYDLQTYHDLQLTDSGTFIHSAWWDESLGKANVSHGCIHLSEANAAVLWNIVQVGDPVTVKGTSKKVSQSNGYADYTLSWSQWLSNSAAGIQVF